MKFFFDNCISFRLADMLRALGVDAVALRHEMDANTDDLTLLETLSKTTDTVLVSLDRAQTRVPVEASALKSANITALYFGRFWSRKELWDQAIWLVRRWKQIEGFAEGTERGTVAVVKENGRAQSISI